MAVLFDSGIFSVIGVASELLVGAKLYWYASGTSTPLATYADEDLTVPNTNPVVADAAGRFPPIYLQQADYKMVLTTATGTPMSPLVTRDPISGLDPLVILSGAAGAGLIGVSHAETYPAATLGDRFKKTVFITDAPYNAAPSPAISTTAIQAALNSGAAHIVFPDSTWKFGALTVPSNVTIDVQSGAVLQAISTLGASERLFNLLDVSNVVINANKAAIQMTRADYGSGEQRHIFNLRGATDITINDARASGAGGDAFYIGASDTGGNNYCERITLNNCLADDNRRNGLSIISVKGLNINGSWFNNSNGTSPSDGIDIEPNDATQFLQGIRIRGGGANGNDGAGLEFAALRPDSTSAPIDIVVDGFECDGNSYNFQIRFGQTGTRGQCVLDNCISRNATANALRDEANAASGFRRIYRNFQSINDLTTNIAYAQSSPILVTEDAAKLRGVVGNIVFDNVEVLCGNSPNYSVNGAFVRVGAADTADNILFKNFKATGYTSVDDEAINYGTASTNLVTVYDIPRIKSYTTDKIIRAAFTGYQLDNTGATGTINLTLPAAIKGRKIMVVVTAAQFINLGRAGSDVINPGGVTSIASNTVGSTLILECTTNGVWNTIGKTGTWV